MKKKMILIMLILAMILPLAACKEKEKPIEKKEISSEDFNKIMLEWFTEDMADDYLTLHFGIEDPSRYGIERPEVTLGEVEVDNEELLSELKERLDTLLAMDVSKLSNDEQLNYKTVLLYYQNMKDQAELKEEYSFLFTPNSGVNNNLITNYTEFVLRSEQDAKDLIELVKDSKRFMDDCLAYTGKQYEKGFVQSEETIDSVIEQVERFISKREDNEVITAFNDHLEELNLDNEETYKQQMKEAVLNYLIPAYEEIIAFYEQNRGSGKDKGGLANYGSDAKRYYELLFRDKSSSAMSVSEWEEILKKAIKTKYSELVKTAQSDEDAYTIWAYDEYDYGMRDAYEILTALKGRMPQDFPAIPEVDYSIDLLDPSVTSDNVAAYYLTSPIDNLNNNVMKANPNYALNDPNDYVVTLAHEGYPGHLYQHTYFFENHKNSEIRYTVDFIGYTEGWAMYVEQYAYDYFSDNEILARLSRIENELNYYLDAYADILVNYEGYDVAKLRDGLNRLSIYMNLDLESAQGLYDLVVGDPCILTPYALGMYQMNELHDQAKSELGGKFNNIEFNKVLLDSGCTSFDILKEEVQKYLSAKH